MYPTTTIKKTKRCIMGKHELEKNRDYAIDFNEMK
jgi:hypothetical protein